MSLGAKLLVGTLVLGAAGTAGTYALTNGGFGIGGNGEGSNENTQTVSNQNTSAPQAGASPSSDAQEGRGGGEAGRAAPETSLNSQQSSNPSTKTDNQGVNASSDDVPQGKIQNAGSSVVPGENGSQIQPAPEGTPPVTITDQNTTGKASLPQTPEGGETDSQKILVQGAREDTGNTDPEKAKGETDGVSGPGSKPEVGHPSGTEDPQSLSRPNPTGGTQDQVEKTEKSTT